MTITMSRAHSPTFLSLHLCQLILQPFRCFTYITAHSPALPLLHLHHSSFSNPSFASPTSQALHLIHLVSRPCIELSHHIANCTLTDFRDPFAQLANCDTPIFKHFLFLLHFCNCFGRNQRLTRTLFVMDVCTSVHELSHPLSQVFDIHTLWPIDFS